MRNRSRMITLFLTTTLAAAQAAPAAAASVNVANWGADSGTCGASTSPCRSITQAIANAAVGGSIVVGPGVYGDIDNDGTLGEPGEETPGIGQYGPAMIDVNKAVTITSSSGAFGTVISPGSDSSLTETFAVKESGVVIGAVGKGFTVLPTSNPGFSIGVSVFDMLTDTVVAGSVFPLTSVGTGILTYSNSEIVGNRFVGPGADIGTANGLIANDHLTSVIGNSASGCYSGLFIASGTDVFTGNMLNGNNYGLYAAAGSFQITKSSFVGNRKAGLYITSGATITVTGSNIAGNGTNGSNCGADIDLSTLTYTGNWWGAPTGPGADPADLSCFGPADTAPASAPFKIKLKGLR